MRCIRVIKFKVVLSRETWAACVVAAVQPSVWYVVIMAREEIHMNTITAKQPYGDELSEQMGEKK